MPTAFLLLFEIETVFQHSALQEWTPAGGEILLAGEAFWRPDGLNFKMKFHLFDLVEQNTSWETVEGPSQTLDLQSTEWPMKSFFKSQGRRSSRYQTRLRDSPGSGQEICISDFDGATSNRSLRINRLTFSPAWAPGGKKIAFTSTSDEIRSLPDRCRREESSTLSDTGVEASPSGHRWEKDRLMMGMEGKSDIYLWIQWRNPRAEKDTVMRLANMVPRRSVDRFRL